MKRLIALFGVVFIFAGCAHAPVSSKPGDAQAPDGKALVVSQDPSLRITHIDGEKTASFLGFLAHGFASQVELTPGDHTVTIWYGDPNRPCRSGYTYAVKAEAGDIFQIKDKPIQYPRCEAAETWIEGMHHGSMVVDSSRYEPVSENTLQLEQSPFFKWAPPQGEGWMIESRNQRGAALARMGTHSRETYVIYLQTFTIPNFQSFQEFADFVKEGRQRDANDKRFTNLEETLLPYSDRSDYCVSFHHKAEDHSPAGQGLFNREPMIMDSYGYICRLPANKNTALQFEYSQRADKGQEDPALSDLAKVSFAKLQF